MPLICKPVHRSSTHPQPSQPVKNQEPSFIFQQSAQPSGQELEISVDENRQTAQGRWNEEQNLKFILFVQYYQDIFASRHKRKAYKIFRTFSQYLTDRTPAQCRSHYQKIILKHKTIPKLKKYYKLIFGVKLYNQQYDAFCRVWELSHPPSPKIGEQIRQCKEAATQTQASLQNSCELCGLKKERDLLSNTLFINPYPEWSNFLQFKNLNGFNYFYYIEQQSNF